MQKNNLSKTVIKPENSTSIDTPQSGRCITLLKPYFYRVVDTKGNVINGLSGLNLTQAKRQLHKLINLKVDCSIQDYQLETYVIVGRLSDQDNIMVFIESETPEFAQQQFLKKIKDEQDWDGKTDIFIEFCAPLSQSVLNYTYNDIFTASTHHYDG